MTACPNSAISLKGPDLLHTFSKCLDCQLKPCVEKCSHEALSLTGRSISPDELTEIVSRDSAFYRNSGGGVTFSGGEPLMQPRFLFKVLQKCKDSGIHTAIETCGWTTLRVLKLIQPFTDLFLFDLKLTDDEKHRFYTGKPVGPILENLAYLASKNSEIIIRMPLIPGITDTPENLEGIAAVMRKNNLHRICLEPYHTLGVDKYTQHGKSYRLNNLKDYHRSQIIETGDFFTAGNFRCECL